MKVLANIIRPKFEIVLQTLDRDLTDCGAARWTNPRGGYFVSLYVMKGCAMRVGELCKEAGLTLTTVGATYPYGIDPYDSNIRIAPSFPGLDELNKAVELLCVCVKLAAVEKLLKDFDI